MGNKVWSILFGVVMLACALSFAVAPFMGWWLPPGLSSHAWDVDFLFYVIFWITAFFFILTEAILVAFMWYYGSTSEGKRPVSETAELTGFMAWQPVKPLTAILHNQHRIELAWTFIPAAILLYIAFAQVNAWANIKYESRKKGYLEEAKRGSALQMAVSARQFEWRIRYPSVKTFKTWKSPPEGKKIAEMTSEEKLFATFGKAPQADDVHVVNEVHLWQDHPVVVHLTTRDVIHSFNLPNFRVKQDALPGKLIPVWFRTLEPGVKKTHNCKYDEKLGRYVDGINPETGAANDNNYRYDVACAELCGWGHYRMIGRVFVHEDQAKFLAWLEFAEKKNQQRTGD